MTYEDRIAGLDIYPGKNGGAYSPAWYYALGISGEAGEVTDKIKKWYRDSTAGDGPEPMVTPEFRNALALELGDVLWYLTRLSNKFGFSLQEIMDLNVSKLEDRQRRNVQRGQGDNR
jgi:NTP pyrophosphatase (non-canonical NTP hydrolase)